MTKTKNKRPNSKYRTPRSWAIPLLVALLLIIVGIIIVLIIKPFSRSASKQTTNPAQKSTTYVETPDSNGQQATNPNTPSDSEAEPEDKTKQFEGEDPNQLDQLTGSITYRNVEQGTLSVAVIINQSLRQPGTCTLILTGPNQERRTATSAAVVDVTASVCETLELPVGGLGHGEYTIEVQLSGDGKSGSVKDRIEL